MTLAVLLLPTLFISPICPTTPPPLIPFIAPNPYPAQPDAAHFYFGTDSLWVSLPKSGKWFGSRQKLFWWRAGYEYRSELRPNLTVIGKRLDGFGSLMPPARAT